MKKVYLSIIFLFIACSSTKYIPTPIEQYNDYLNQTDIKKVEIYYDDVVQRIGEQVLKNDHENDFVATWQEVFTRKARVANEMGGRKLILTFDKTTKRLIDWKYKTW